MDEDDRRKKIIAMDESGNTQPICAFSLVSIPYNLLPAIEYILAVDTNEPDEIQTLFHEVCSGEFKYTQIRRAYLSTKLPVYDKFLRRTLDKISKLEIQAYVSIFPNPKSNEERLKRLHNEAAYLIHKWAHQNRADAFDHELEITVDQQVFREPYIFEYFRTRSEFGCAMVPKTEFERARDKGELRKLGKAHSNVIEIRDFSSKTHKTIQLTDILVGCARERMC